MKRYVIIVQARMGSKRLPGKMMLDLQGVALIDHVLERLWSFRELSDQCLGVALATSRNPENGPLVSHVRERFPGVTNFEGSENDVLSRILEVLERYPDATNCVRVTGDCPLVNLDALAVMLESHEETNASITNYEPGHEYVDKGLEVISCEALQRVAQSEGLAASDREHVTPFIYQNPERFKVNYIASDSLVRRADIRITVDTSDDLRFLELALNGIGKPVSDTTVYDVLEFVEQNRESLLINQNSGGKSSRHEAAQILFRCDGGSALGMGHIHGAVRLARLLSLDLSVGIEFLVKENPAVVSLLKKGGFAVEVLPANVSPADDVTRIIEKRSEGKWSAVVVNFSRDQLIAYEHQFARLRELEGRLVFQDNPLVSSQCADLTVNALPHPDDCLWKQSSPGPTVLDGLEYFIVSDEFLKTRDVRKQPSKQIDRLLVCLGGGDHSNITLKVLRVLQATGFAGYVDVVLGHANENRAILEDWWVGSGLGGSISFGVDDMADRMLLADFGISGVGLTAYEMLFMELPHAILSSHALNDAVAVKHASRWPGCSYLGRGDELSWDELEIRLLSAIGGSAAGVEVEGTGRGLGVGSRTSEIVDWFKENTVDV